MWSDLRTVSRQVLSQVQCHTQWPTVSLVTQSHIICWRPTPPLRRALTLAWVAPPLDVASRPQHRLLASPPSRTPYWPHGGAREPKSLQELKQKKRRRLGVPVRPAEDRNGRSGGPKKDKRGRWLPRKVKVVRDQSERTENGTENFRGR